MSCVLSFIFFFWTMSQSPLYIEKGILEKKDELQHSEPHSPCSVTNLVREPQKCIGLVSYLRVPLSISSPAPRTHSVILLLSLLTLPLPTASSHSFPLVGYSCPAPKMPSHHPRLSCSTANLNLPTIPIFLSFQFSHNVLYSHILFPESRMTRESRI